MQKITGFTILNITMNGFKCFKDKKSFDLGDMTIIRGANRLGKSSFADAISFAFTGSNFFGEKGLDKLHSADTPEMEVSIKFADESGEIHNLTRSHKNDATAISFDGMNVRQHFINDVLCGKDLFLSMLNPLYFIESLGADGKELLEQMLPVIGHSEVLAALPESVKSDMENESLISPETYIKNKREEIRDSEKDIIYLHGQKDSGEAAVKEAQTALEQLKPKLKEIESKINFLEAEQAIGSLSTGDEERLSALSKMKEELSLYKEDSSEIIRLTRAVEAKKSEIAEAKAQIYKSAFTNDIAEKEAALKLLYKEYGELERSVGKLKPGYQCPSCFTEVTPDNLPALKETVDNKTKTCVSSGKTVKAELESLKKLDSTAERLFNEAKGTKLNNLEEQLQQLIEDCAAAEADKEIAASEQNKKLAQINKDITGLEYLKENGRLTPVQLRELEEYRQEKYRVEAQIQVNEAALIKPNYTKDITETEKRINGLKSKVNNAAFYVAKKNELLLKGLPLNRVRIQLNEIVKSTGEIKDTYKFTYEGREYKRLSLSEKVLAGLELTELIKNLSGRNYPTFIDNSESVCVIDNVRPKSQLIFALVEKGKPLTVTFREKSLRKAG